MLAESRVKRCQRFERIRSLCKRYGIFLRPFGDGFGDFRQNRLQVGHGNKLTHHWATRRAPGCGLFVDVKSSSDA